MQFLFDLSLINSRFGGKLIPFRLNCRLNAACKETVRAAEDVFFQFGLGVGSSSFSMNLLCVQRLELHLQLPVEEPAEVP